MSPLNEFHCFAIQCCSDAELRRAGSTPIPRDGQPILSYDAVRNWITTTGFTYDMTRLHCKCDRKFAYALDIGVRFQKSVVLPLN
jgi:hypothetical protein